MQSRRIIGGTSQ